MSQNSKKYDVIAEGDLFIVGENSVFYKENTMLLIIKIYKSTNDASYITNCEYNVEQTLGIQWFHKYCKQHIKRKVLI